MSWLSYLDPFNWPADLSNSFISQLEAGLLYVLDLVLNSILGIFNSIFGWLMLLFESLIGDLIDTAISIGPLALPVFVIGFVCIVGVAYVIFGGIKDVPVVGDFI
ncbi:hypothetical protein [Caldiplasma sukawensis]